MMSSIGTIVRLVRRALLHRSTPNAPSIHLLEDCSQRDPIKTAKPFRRKRLSASVQTRTVKSK
jgi:hypothetical protein